MLQCTQRRPEALSVEWIAHSHEKAPVMRCEVQISGWISWRTPAFASGKQPMKSTEDFNNSWSSVIVGLDSSTEYAVRVRTTNLVGTSDWEEASFKTSELPLEPVKFNCVGRYATSLDLEWSIADPDGAPVTHCEMQVSGSLSWSPVTCPADSKIQRVHTDHWKAIAADLLGATSYNVRLRAVNAVGEGPWLYHTFRTSEFPSEPSQCACLSRHPKRLSLEWSVEDPEGAEVTQCEVQCQGSFGWSSASFESPPKRVRDTFWQVDVIDLMGDTAYDFRIRGSNLAGEGKWLMQQFKTSETPREPTDFKCTERLPHQLSFEWYVADPEGALVTTCELQVRGTMGWTTPIISTESLPHRFKEGAEMWKTTVTELSGGTEYEFRVRGRNDSGDGIWTTQTFKTSDPPSDPSFFQCTGRFADKLALEWHLDDPDGAPIQECDVQVQGSLSWSSASLEGDQSPQRGKDGNWSVVIDSLLGNTEYGLRVRGRNVVGDGTWTQKSFKTSEVPGELLEFRCLKKTAATFSLQWELEDPEGAPVKTCEVQLQGSLSWFSPNFEENAQPQRMQGNRWRCTIVDLAGDTEYDVRARGQNLSGDGKWVGRKFKTAERPREPTDFACTKRLPNQLSLAWRVADPEGAEVTSCKIEVRSWSGFTAATFVDGEPSRVEDDRWQAVIGDLTGDTQYEIRLCGTNASGDGNWLMLPFHTSEKPAAPSQATCGRQSADTIWLEWTVQDPDGAPVTKCEVQKMGALAWFQAQFADGGEPVSKGEANRWAAAITGLTVNTPYSIRIRALNAIGEGQWSEPQEFRTQGKPEQATSFTWSHSESGKITFEWRVPDPEGAPINACEIEELCRPAVAAPYWKAASCDRGASPVRVSDLDGMWRVVVEGFPSGTDSSIRIRAYNVAGAGNWKRFDFRTSEEPGPPADLICVRQLAERLQLEWRVVDPAMAPVNTCELQVNAPWTATGMLWQAADVEDMCRLNSTTEMWTGIVTGLRPGTTYNVRVRGTNFVGEGKWAQQQFKTQSN